MTEKLLADMTTGNNIIWAADDYKNFRAESEIYPAQINLIKPRFEKVRTEQKRRTKNRAEIFTPSWICNLQNNLIDEKYFGRANVFNTAENQTWTPNTEKIFFGEKNWQDYILQKRLEITCGEAPYLVSRYDTVTGAAIPIENRIGLLDRKLRVVNENTDNQTDWEIWAVKAVQSCYGYEFQGDNLFLARRNVFETFIDYFERQFDKKPARKLLEEVAEIICWNLWQMDGLQFTIPFAKITTGLFESFLPENQVYCIVKDWQTSETFLYKDLLKGGF